MHLQKNNLRTYSCYPITVSYMKVSNSEYSQISEPALELHSRAAPSVGGNITAQLVLTQEEISGEGRYKKMLPVKYLSRELNVLLFPMEISVLLLQHQ